MSTPPELPSAPDAAEHLARERALFDARRRTLDEQIASLHAQMREAQAQAAALQTQIEATETSAKLAAEELQINEKLVQQGFVHRTRLLALQRSEADYACPRRRIPRRPGRGPAAHRRAAGAHRAGAQPVSAARPPTS